MNIFCWLRSHKFMPTKVFYTDYVDAKGEHLYYDSNYTGHECKRCGERKIVPKYQHLQTGSIGERQSAYDWANDIKKPQKAQILKLVK